MRKSIPCYARFAWLNHKRVRDILRIALTPPQVGRKGYDKATMFRWLLYKQVMRCSYRDLESMTGIDHSTFVKFRQRLVAQNWFVAMFHALSSGIENKATAPADCSSGSTVGYPYR